MKHEINLIDNGAEKRITIVIRVAGKKYTIDEVGVNWMRAEMACNNKLSGMNRVKQLTQAQMLEVSNALFDLVNAKG